MSLELASYAYHSCDFLHSLNVAKSIATVDSIALRIKAYCELDQMDLAIALAESALIEYPENGQIHYLAGTAQYLAGASYDVIEKHFIASKNLRYESADLGISFLYMAKKDIKKAIMILERLHVSDQEMQHIILLMLAQFYLMDNDTAASKNSLENAERVLKGFASHNRYLWGLLTWGRYFRATSKFKESEEILERLFQVVDSNRQPRLHRNAVVARDLVKSGDSSQQHINLPPLEISADVFGQISKKPVLNSMFSFLHSRGLEGASKSDISSAIWQEAYDPLRHDDRIYKTIGRLRSVMGEDKKCPRYLTQKGQVYILNACLKRGVEQ